MSGTKRLLGVLISAAGFAAGLALAQDYSDEWGPAVGTRIPVLEAYDQAGNLRTLENLSGDRGLLLFLNRSADW